jgi:hypothetical protein
MSIIRRITNLFSRTSVDREIDDELEAHIALRGDDNIASGMSPAVARRDALLRFGNPIATRERVVAMDVAYGWRTSARTSVMHFGSYKNLRASQLRRS